MAGSAEEQKRKYQRSGNLAWLRQCLFPLPRQEDVERRTIADEEIKQTLEETSDVDAAAAMLRERAERVQVSREERGRAAEAGATILLGTVPIAASLVVAGAGLVLDKNTVMGSWSVLITVEWSELIMAIVVLLLLLLLACGFTASRAVLKVRMGVGEPRLREALNWASSFGSQDIRVQQVQDLVKRADETCYVAEFKRAQLKVAYYWYRAALVCFALLGFVLLLYGVAR